MAYNRLFREHSAIFLQTAMDRKMDSRVSKSLASMVHYGLLLKVSEKDHVHALTAFQDVINAKISIKNGYNIKFNIISQILVKNKAKWKYFDTISWDQFFQIIRNQFVSLKSNEDLMICLICMWYGNTKPKDEKNSFILNDNKDSYHTRAVFQLMLNKWYTMYIGLDANGERHKLYDFIYKYFKGVQKKPYTKTMGYDNICINMTDINEGYFNFGIDTSDNERLYACDVGAVVGGYCEVWAVVYLYGDILKIRNGDFCEVYNGYKNNGGVDRHFVDRKKSDLDKKVRFPIMEKIQSVICQLTEMVYGDIIKIHQAPRLIHSNQNKEKRHVQMPRSNQNKSKKRSDKEENDDDEEEENEDGDEESMMKQFPAAIAIYMYQNCPVLKEKLSKDKEGRDLWKRIIKDNQSCETFVKHLLERNREQYSPVYKRAIKALSIRKSREARDEEQMLTLERERELAIERDRDQSEKEDDEELSEIESDEELSAMDNELSDESEKEDDNIANHNGHDGDIGVPAIDINDMDVVETQDLVAEGTEPTSKKQGKKKKDGGRTTAKGLKILEGTLNIDEKLLLLLEKGPPRKRIKLS